jgi:hypothetical protein
MNMMQLQALVSYPSNTSNGGNIYYEYHETAIADELVEMGLTVGDYTQNSQTHKAYKRSKRGDQLVAELLAFSNRLMEEITL